jgi:hypothetical protein
LTSKVALNALGGAAIGAAAGTASSAISNEGDVKGADVLANAGFGAIGGGAASLVGDGLQAAGAAIASQKIANMTVADRQLRNAIVETSRTTGKVTGTEGLGGAAGAATANVAANAVANSGGLAVEACKAKDGCQ